MKNIYIAELDRFGYTLTVAETTEKKARDAIISAYIKAFEDINGFHPADEESDRSYDGNTWLEDAEEDIVIFKMGIGEVWYR